MAPQQARIAQGSQPGLLLHGFAGRSRAVRANPDPVESYLRRLQTARKGLLRRVDLVVERGGSTQSAVERGGMPRATFRGSDLIRRRRSCADGFGARVGSFEIEQGVEGITEPKTETAQVIC
jgi:hypothetical protein